MAEICINKMSFFAHHGCFEEERKIGTNFQVDCELEADTSLAEDLEADSLSVMQIIMEMEEEFGLTVEDIVKKIKEKLKKR